MKYFPKLRSCMNDIVFMRLHTCISLKCFDNVIISVMFENSPFKEGRSSVERSRSSLQFTFNVRPSFTETIEFEKVRYLREFIPGNFDATDFAVCKEVSYKLLGGSKRLGLAASTAKRIVPLFSH